MKKQPKIFRIFVYIVLILVALSIIVPVAWVFMSSIKENAEFYGNPWNLPKGFYFQNFVDAWQKANMGDYLLNSVIVTAMSLVILLVVAVPCSYVLSRMEFKGRKFLRTLMKAGLFINLSYIVIPIFLVLLDLNVTFKTQWFLNNRIVLAIIYAATSIPFTVYLLSNFFSSISKTYEEGELLTKPIEDELLKDSRIEKMDAILDPTSGAALMALKYAGVEITDDIVENLKG